MHRLEKRRGAVCAGEKTRWLWLALLAPAAQACELPGGTAQKIESPQHTVLYRTAPLRDVVNHYSTIGPDRLHSDGEAIPKALKLTEQESQDLVAFLESLQDGGKLPAEGVCGGLPLSAP